MVRLKFGRASLSVRGSGVCINMNAMEGRSRTIFELGKLHNCSRSRYLLLRKFSKSCENEKGVYSSQKAIV